jgi:hypothetical protein
MAKPEWLWLLVGGLVVAIAPGCETDPTDPTDACTRPLAEFAGNGINLVGVVDRPAARASALTQCESDDLYSFYTGHCGDIAFLAEVWPNVHTIRFFDATGKPVGVVDEGDIAVSEACWGQGYGKVPGCMSVGVWGLAMASADGCEGCEVPALDPALAATVTTASAQAESAQECSSGGIAWKGGCGGTSYVVASSSAHRRMWFFDGKGKLIALYETPKAAVDGCATPLQGRIPADAFCGTWWQGWLDQPESPEVVLCGGK